MWGAIIGDIVGSRFEFRNLKSKEFELFTPRNDFTDDTVMTVAIAEALMNSAGSDDETVRRAAVESMRRLGRKYPDCGFGGMFRKWVMSDLGAYESFGNGAAMRVSAVGYVASNEADVKRLSRLVTEVTHNHPEGIKGAEAVALCVFLSLNGSDKEDIRKRIESEYYPEIETMSVNNIRPGNRFDCTCRGSVPHALGCFFESESFEDAIRNAVSIGGDSDTIAAIAGSIAEAYFGVPDDIKTAAKKYLPSDLLEIATRFSEFVKK